MKKVERGTETGLAGAVFRLTQLSHWEARLVDPNGNDLGEYYVDDNGNVLNAGDPGYHHHVEDLADDIWMWFEIRGTKTAGTFVSGADGSIPAGALEAGSYSIEEISPPAGYVLPETIGERLQFFDVPFGGGYTAGVVFANKKLPGLTVIKVDEDTGLPLAGAEFSIAHKNGYFLHEAVTTSSGVINLEGLPEGWYTVTELAAPSGYLKRDESKEVFLPAGGTAQVKFDNRLRPALRITKIDSATGLPLAGAVFHVRKTEDATVSEYVTDASGTILILDLDEAVYTVYEVKAPDGYLLDVQHKDIKLEWGKAKNLVFENKAQPAFEILKVDEESGRPLAGAKFRVAATEGGTVSEYVTDASGRILVTGLRDITYSVNEVVAPDGYLLDLQHKDIKLEWGETKQLVFTNKAKPKLRILKVDAVTGQPLPYAEFRVTKVEDATVSEYITDETGEIIIDNLDEAVYRALEFMAPDGYLLYTESKEIMLEWGKTKTLKFDDIRKPTLVITKTNALTFEPVPNAVFKVEYEDSGGGVHTFGTYRTDANGQIVLPKVDPGWYIITEIQAAPGFSLPSNPVTRKYLAPGENSYTNFGAAGLGGDASGANVMALSGFDFMAGQEIFDYPLNSVVIRKVSAVTGGLLAGAAFELRRVTEDVSGSSGALIGRYTTDNSGTIVITGLQPGGYIVAEVQAPANYLLSENAQQQVWLKPDGTSIVEATFSNIPYGAILITKVDAQTSKPLANARFRVTDNSGAVLGNTNGEFVTDSNGEILIPNVKPGSYVATEIEAPEHYAVDTTPQTVAVGLDGKVYKLSFKNQPAGTLVIRKLDAVSKEPLAGAHFKVTTSGGNVVGTSGGIFKTDATGTVTIPHLPKGSYIALEIDRKSVV
jgi:uncharacterized surface anchored protein